MRALVLCASQNSEGRHDATGAFIPQAQTFCRVHGLNSPTMFDNTLADAARERSAISAIAAAPQPLECFAYFGHGSSRGLTSLGFSGGSDTRQLAEALIPVSENNLVVLLYACSAANEFAPQLASLLRTRLPGARVFGHTTVAHTTQNPFMKEFPGDRWVVPPTSGQFSRWGTALRMSRLWAVFPWLTAAQLDEVLAMDATTIDHFLNINGNMARRSTRPRRRR